MTTLKTAAVRASGWRVLGHANHDRYRVHLAETDLDLFEAQRLRFEVFNLELGEGLAAAHGMGRDEDEFDPVCDHLLVREAATDKVVGTYRLQTGRVATANLGFYSAREFDLTGWEFAFPQILELGRACVHREHRNLRVLALLWRGIAEYAIAHRVRYLIGCSSVPGQDEAAAWRLFDELWPSTAAPQPFRCAPWPSYQCRRDLARDSADVIAPPVPKLLQAYFSFGAKICGPPALDREFGTIDFLTWLDLHNLDERVGALYLGELWPMLQRAAGAVDSVA
ncbi:MAG: GNAT family N-acetyltransferase [Verrucomicrobiae bacterium]|nr:GNAT family N-acetyltransferase [Verrucomicrobiae bacterium]MDW8345021.1 GNAT family N-acyltransferase [Verrucomicrobiae bacterium]